MMMILGEMMADDEPDRRDPADAEKKKPPTGAPPGRTP
jgi:hypothetical protein